MQINYYKYDCQFLEKIIGRKDPSIYIFSNYKSKIKSEKRQNKSFLRKRSLFLNLKEFKEKISPTQKIILREEKLTSIFYKLLTNREKKLLKINDYFDVIEISSKFYNFFIELEAYYPEKELSNLRNIMNNKLKLKEWQKEKFDIFFDIRKRYYNYMSNKGFIDQNSAFSKENFNDHYFSDYTNIIFVNKLKFDNKEKDLLNFLETKGYSVELALQLKKEDFSEKKLKLKSFTLPEQKKGELKLFTLKDKLLELTNSILKLNNNNHKKIDILDCDFKSQNYNKYLNKNLIEVDKNRSFTETKIYRFLKRLKSIFNTADRKNGYLKLEIENILKAVNSEIFKDYYGISNLDKNKIITFKNNNYVYLTEKMLRKEDLSSCLRIFSDIKTLKKVNTFTEFISFFKNIDLSKLNDKVFKNNYDVYYSSIHEIESLAEMDIIDNWKNYFNNLAEGFMKFFLNYLRFKEVKEFDLCNKNPFFKISSFKTAPEITREKLSIINASSNILTQKENDFILSNKQRENLGLIKADEKNLIEKYYFMRHVLSSDQTYIFSKKDLENNISESSYVEELALKYNLDINEPNFNKNNFNTIIKQIFKNDQEKLHDFTQRDLPPNFKNEKLIMEKNDFSDYSSLSYYRFKRIKDCQYRYFLEYMIELQKNDFEVDKQISVMVFGSLVHEIFAKIIENVDLSLELNTEKINKITEEVLNKYDLKINNYFKRYYNNILFEKVKKSVNFFLKDLRKKPESQLKEILIELSNKDWVEKMDSNTTKNIFYENDFSKFYLNGRVDLLLRTEKKNFIIDFKTGGSDTDQLDFYELMLFPENDQTIVAKMIYSVLEEKFNSSYKSKIEFSSDIKEELNKFMEKKIYTRIYKSRCNNCPYYDICRVVLK